MTSANVTTTQREVDEKAASWLLALQSEELSATQRAEFIDWLRESPHHISSMLRICKVDRVLANFSGWGEISSGRAKSSDVVELFAHARVHATTKPKRVIRTRWLGGLAAGVAALCVGAVMFESWGDTEYVTQAGETRQITLADGSVMDVSPKSDLIVRYSDKERSIALKQGLALFHVAKNPERPFVVQAAATRVRAVGTVFNVERTLQGVSVTVVEGRVAVSQQPAGIYGGSDTHSSSPLLGLKANEQVSISTDGITSAVRNVGGLGPDVPDDQFTFENETVAEVARRFNLRNRTQIDIQDARMAARRVSGVFQATDLQSFIAFIEATGDTKISRPDANHIVVGTDSSHAR